MHIFVSFDKALLHFFQQLAGSSDKVTHTIYIEVQCPQ